MTAGLIAPPPSVAFMPPWLYWKHFWHMPDHNTLFTDTSCWQFIIILWWSTSPKAFFTLFPNYALPIYEVSTLAFWLYFSQFLHLYSASWLLLCISGYKQATAKLASTGTSFGNHPCTCLYSATNVFPKCYKSIFLLLYSTVNLLCSMNLGAWWV